MKKFANSPKKARKFVRSPNRYSQSYDPQNHSIDCFVEFNEFEDVDDDLNNRKMKRKAKMEKRR